MKAQEDVAVLVAALSILELTGMPLAADTRRGVLLQEVRRGPKTSPRACCKKLGEAQFINKFCAGNVSKPVALYTRFCKIFQV